MIDTGGPLGPADAAQLGLQLGSAVRYLHDTYTGPWPQPERPAASADELGDVPASLAEVIAVCMRTDPASRPGIVEMMAALEPLTGMPTSEWRWRAASVDSARAWPSPTAPRRSSARARSATW